MSSATTTKNCAKRRAIAPPCLIFFVCDTSLLLLASEQLKSFVECSMWSPIKWFVADVNLIWSANSQGHNLSTDRFNARLHVVNRKLARKINCRMRSRHECNERKNYRERAVIELDDSHRLDYRWRCSIDGLHFDSVVSQAHNLTIRRGQLK